MLIILVLIETIIIINQYKQYSGAKELEEYSIKELREEINRKETEEMKRQQEKMERQQEEMERQQLEIELQGDNE